MEKGWLAVLVPLAALVRMMPAADNVLRVDYCVIGGGPAGLQMGHLLAEAGRHYVVIEKSNISGSFFARYPRHRRLISINKRSTGKRNREFNFRHDWNSLLSKDPRLVFSSYSQELFPQAQQMVQYLNEFQRLLHIRVRFNTLVTQIRRQHETKTFLISTNRDFSLQCRWVIVATGLWLPNVPTFPGSQLLEMYDQVSVNPKEFHGQRVLILGRGNSAFETANNIYGETALVHMVSRSRARLAWSTHYVGDLRAVNNDLLDTYQLKSLDGLLEADVRGMTLRRSRGGKLRVRFNSSLDLELASDADSFALRDAYDRVIACLGFKFDDSIFHRSTRPARCRLASKYPAVKSNYESENVAGLFFAGTLAHSLDFRRSAGGFIHGFRYTVQALHRLLERKNHGVAWASRSLPLRHLVNTLLVRVNQAAATYQMFGQLADVYLIRNNNKSEFMLVPEFPAALVGRLDELAGHSGAGGSVLVSLLEYGADFSGPAKDTFRPDRATGDPQEAHRSNFLHPVLYFYRQPPTETDLLKDDHGTHLLPRPDKTHHVLEDFLTQWTAPTAHVLPLRRFLQSCLGRDLSSGSARGDCFVSHLESKTDLPACFLDSK
ncbi:Hypothetical predicted protein [Cloeon dipterum]|uniref:FAD/NAD(P)-binding domain-containing protein n=1 Tax=Cloeon dipterum TaxID=197152 RepID=A0A8S1DP59_9INSE|nr:Hypothetical predicted protein [Cloeon dipterum]